MNSRMIALAVGLILTSVGLGAFALSNRGPADRGLTVAGLVETLRAGPMAGRREAVATLGLVRGPKAESASRALIEAIMDRDAELRGRSARALGGIIAGNPWLVGAVEPLRAMLGDEEPRVRTSAAIGLRSAGLDPPGAFEAILDGFRSDDPLLRAESGATLASWPIVDATRLRRLLTLVEDPVTDIRTAARRALTRPGLSLAPEVALPVLGAVLNGGSTPLRVMAATMLGRSVARVPAGRDTLIMALKDRDPGVRAIAAASLGAFSEEGLARSALRAAMDDAELRVRATASASLAIGRRAARAETLAELSSAFGGDASRSGIGREVEADPSRAVPRLINALRDPNPRVRAAAARGLGEVGPMATRATVDALILGLSDPDPTVRRASASTLARLGPDAANAANALRRATRDGDRGVSAHALVAVQAIEGVGRTR